MTSKAIDVSFVTLKRGRNFEVIKLNEKRKKESEKTWFEINNKTASVLMILMVLTEN